MLELLVFLCILTLLGLYKPETCCLILGVLIAVMMAIVGILAVARVDDSTMHVTARVMGLLFLFVGLPLAMTCSIKCTK